ncbi:MAG: response regulator [Xanthomonadales bacterium]|nr:response regulator [Xanthomonadales bacterium]
MNKPEIPTIEPSPHEAAAWISRFNFDLRNSLNALLSAATLLRDTSLDSEQAELVSVIDHEGADLRIRINQLIDLNDVETGRVALEDAEIFIPSLVSEVVDLYRTRAEDKGLDIWANISRATARWIQCDPGRLRQILINLVENAVEYSESGRVRMVIGRQSGNLVFSVKDDGPGLPDEIMGLINGEPETGDGLGLGLGLCVAVKGAHLLHGRLSARKVKRGSRIDLVLPASICIQKKDRRMTKLRRLARKTRVCFGNLAARKDSRVVHVASDWRLDARADEKISTTAVLLDPKMGEINKALSESDANTIIALCTSDKAMARLKSADHPSVFVFPYPACSYRLLCQIILPQYEMERAGFSGAGIAEAGGKRVLVVDDSVANQMVTASMCKHLGHQVTAVGSGREAIQTAKQIPFDVILMDIQMPGMDGIEAATRIQREAAQDATAPIIAVTANTLSVDRRACQAAGMVDYLAKPVNRDKLRRAIEHWGTRTRTLRDQRQLQQLMSTALFEPHDLKRLEKEVDRTIIPDIADAYLKESRVRLLQIELALAEDRIEDIVSYAHPLKSSSGSFGARRLRQWATYLESAAKGGHRREIEAVFGDVETCFEETRGQLVAYTEAIQVND